MNELTHERYANFYTDFAFKKLFGTEANKECLISFLNALFDGKEEIANFSASERRDYRESQKDFWDLYAVTETAERKGREEGLVEGRKKEKLDNARNLKRLGVDSAIIAQATGLTIKEIEQL